MYNIAETQLLSRPSLPVLLRMGITGSTATWFGIVSSISSLVYLLKCWFLCILEELWKHQVLVLHAVRNSNVQAQLLRLVKAVCSSASHLGKRVAPTHAQVLPYPPFLESNKSYLTSEAKVVLKVQYRFFLLAPSTGICCHRYLKAIIIPFNLKGFTFHHQLCGIWVREVSSKGSSPLIGYTEKQSLWFFSNCDRLYDHWDGKSLQVI